MSKLENFDSSKDIETRKVQKLGSSSLFITLPKKWINKWNIKPGDKILIEISDDGTLKLLAEKIKLLSSRKSIKVDIDALKQPLSNVILCLYSLGYDEIIFESKKSISQKDIDDLITTVKQIVGAEVTEALENRVKIECLLDAEKIGLESLLRRMLNIISRKIDELISYLSKESNKGSNVNHEDLRRVYLMLLRHAMGTKYEISNNMSKNTLITMNAEILLHASKVIDKIGNLIRSENSLVEIDTSILKEILHKINDLLDEIVMSILFPSLKRITNGFTLLSQINNLLPNLSKNQLLYIHFTDLVEQLQMALENSSCTLFLEDMPWIERNFNMMK